MTAAGGQGPPVTREDAEELIAAINARDFDAIAELPWVHPRFEFRSALSALEGEVHIGIEGLREWMRGMESVWSDFRIELQDFRELPDGRFFTTYIAHGTAKGSSVPLEAQTAQIWSMKDGQMWRNQSYVDVHQAQRDAGLRD